MIRKTFRQMLTAQILSAMTVMLCMLVDSIMIGRFLGVDSVAAYGLANPVLLIFAAYGSMLSAGIQVLCGKTMGAGDRDATDACYTVALVLGIGVSLIGMVLILLFASPVCTLLGAGKAGPDNPVFFLTRDYLRGFIIGAPAFIIAQIMVPFLQISGNRTRLAAAVLLMTVSDIAFDLLNVFVFKGGTFGMGLASSLSYYAALLIGGTYFLKKDCLFRFRPKAIRLRRAGELLKYGVPTVINQLSLVALVFTLNKILLSVGANVAVAAYSVVSTVGNICYCFGTGVASVALLLSSVSYSEEDRHALHDLVKTMSIYAVVLDVLVTVAVLLLAPLLVQLFLTDNPGARSLAALGIRLFALSLLPCSLNTSFKNYYQGVNRTLLTEAISVMQNFAFPALFAFILSAPFGTTGAFLCFVCGETLTLAVIAAIVWIKNRRVSFSAESFALLPKSFGALPKDLFEATVRTNEQAAKTAQEAAVFCRAHGESERSSMLISLCVEEMVENIVTHGFKEGKRNQSVDVRIVFKEDARVIRIRDNCMSFDPLQYLKLHEADDPFSHIGIRMVAKLVKRADYVNVLGLNSLTLIL